MRNSGLEEFAKSVDAFLTFQRYEILPDNGKVAIRQAEEKAESEYAVFNKTQKIDSDFDKEVRKMLSGGIGN